MGDRYVGNRGRSESKAVSTKGGQQQGVQQQWTTRVKHEDKASGSYQRYTAKEKVSSGQQFVEKSTGRVGYKDEAQRSSTVKIGDKSGYTEVYTEQKVKTVTYGNNNSGYANLYCVSGFDDE